MSKEYKKVIVVGGGSAGWMSAATIAKLFPEKEVVVIESPETPVVGVGESTIAGIRNWMSILGIKEDDFLKHVQGSYKLSIKFTDFYDKDAGSFHYPFGNPYFDGAPFGLNTWHIKNLVSEEAPPEDYAITWSPQMALVEKNRFNKNLNEALGNYNADQDVAYHFDSALFGLWLRESFCRPLGVTHISDTVVEINKGAQGIESLKLSSGKEITADLYIDCTGWKSLLLGETLQEPFVSYEDILPNNRAWATKIPYTNKQVELEPFTNCTALGNGWAWNIPLWSRLGAGYVYSDKYVEPEKALEEFKNYLRSDKMAFPDSERDLESLEFKDIKFRVGIHERTWVKNVVAIGLSSSFIEPLESNGLFSVHTFLLHLVKALNKENISKFDRDMYNSTIRLVFDDLAAFIALHYALSNRRDTEYWRDISERTFDPSVEYPSASTAVGFQDFSHKYMIQNRHNEFNGIHYIATGMRYYPIKNIELENYKHQNPGLDYEMVINHFSNNRDMWKKSWEDFAEKSPTLYEYLKDTHYKEER